MVSLNAAVCVSVVLLGVLGFGYGPIPALGPALDPGRGAWTSAAGGEPGRSQPLPGYRAAAIYAALRNRAAPLTPGGFAAVQTSLTGQLAERVLPRLLTVLSGASLSASERAVARLLSTWNARMAALWWPALSGAPAGATARVIAALAGLPPHAWAAVTATLVIGILQCVAALWLARAVKRAFS